MEFRESFKSSKTASLVGTKGSHFSYKHNIDLTEASADEHRAIEILIQTLKRTLACGGHK